MQTRSSLQRRSNSESSDRVVAHIKPRPWGGETHEQPQTVQPKNTGFDFKNADWFSHDPGPRSPVRVFNTIQAKLTVGAPNDVYEQEADRVAEQVMSTPDSATQSPIQREMASEELQAKPLAATITPLVQRDMAPEEDEDESLAQTKPIQREVLPGQEDEEENLAQTKPSQQTSPDAGFQAGDNLENRLNSSQGGGSLLPDEVRSFMEPRFGADFSQVRVHTGNEAVQMNQDLNAQAFTHKQDVYFGAGKAPANDALTAHELTHVVQQTSQKVQPLLQRDDDEPSKAAELKPEIVWLPIDLKDKDGKLISTQSVTLQLSLITRAPLNTTAGGFKFSLLKPQLSLALGAAFTKPTGTATDITKSLSGEGSVSIVGVKISGLSRFLPGTKIQVGGKLSCEADIDTHKVETKVEPSLVLKIPVLGSTFNVEATPSGAKLVSEVMF